MKTKRALKAYDEYMLNVSLPRDHGFIVRNVPAHLDCPDPRRCELESGTFFDDGIAYRNHWLYMTDGK